MNTLHKGKGYLVYTPESSYNYYLKLNLGTRNGDIKKQVNPNYDNLYWCMPAFDYEISFTINNKYKVLENEDDLEIVFMTNDLVRDNDTYYITV